MNSAIWISTAPAQLLDMADAALRIERDAGMPGTLAERLEQAEAERDAARAMATDLMRDLETARAERDDLRDLYGRSYEAGRNCESSLRGMTIERNDLRSARDAARAEGRQALRAAAHAIKTAREWMQESTNGAISRQRQAWLGMQWSAALAIAPPPVEPEEETREHIYSDVDGVRYCDTCGYAEDLFTNRSCSGFHGVLGPKRTAAPHAQEETKPAEAFGTCDWGGCDGEVVDHRWSAEHGWLAVCRTHTDGCTCPNENTRVGSCPRHGWRAQSEHEAEEAGRRLGAELAAASRVRKETPDEPREHAARVAALNAFDAARRRGNSNDVALFEALSAYRALAPSPSLRELLTSAREALFDSLAAYPGPLAGYEIGWDRDSGSYAVYDIPRDPSGASIGMTLVKSGFEGPQDAGRWIGLARVDVHLAAVADALEPREEAS